MKASDELRVQKKCNQELRTIEMKLGNIIARQANDLMKREPNGTQRSILLVAAVSKLRETASAILHLGKLGYVDEMSILLRTMVELTINVCYLQYATDEELSRYLHHDPIAGYIALQDMSRAAKGGMKVPQELATRVKKMATDAESVSGLSLDSRVWNVNRQTLHQRATIVDEKTGRTDFAGMLALVYVTASGYVHGGYKTLHKHALYLTHGEVDHPLRTMFGVNNVIHGVGYVQLILARYFAGRFDLSTQLINELVQEGELISNTSHKDYQSHRRAKRPTQGTATAKQNPRVN